MKEVLADLLAGPQVDGPTTAPPVHSGQQASSDTATLSFLIDHVIPSQEDQTIDNLVYLNPNKVVDYADASASSFFQESTDLYFELSDLDSDDSSAYRTLTQVMWMLYRILVTSLVEFWRKKYFF